MVTSKPRRPARFGAEVWAERFGQEWSLWDLWHCVVIELDHDGDPDGLRRVFVEAIRSPGYGSGRNGEAMLNHLDDLLSRLAEVDRRPGEVPGPEEFADKALVKRARDKVDGRVSLEWRAKTEPMLNTPRVRFETQARFGWDAFPCDPARFYERLRPIADGKSHVNKYKSFDVVDRLVTRLAELDGARRQPADRVSLYRAFHTAGLVLADRTDDSHGNVGEARTTAWQPTCRSTGKPTAPSKLWPTSTSQPDTSAASSRPRERSVHGRGSRSSPWPSTRSDRVIGTRRQQSLTPLTSRASTGACWSTAVPASASTHDRSCAMIALMR